MAKKRKTELDIETTATVPVAEAAPPPATPASQAMEEEEKPVSRPRSLKIPLIVSLVVILLLSLGIVVRKVATTPKKHDTVAKKKEKPKPKAEVKFTKLHNAELEPFIFPYKTKSGQDGFIRLGLSLQVNDPDVIFELDENKILIRNSVIFYMGTRNPEDLLSETKRKGILRDLQFNLDRSLQNGHIEAVLLSELAVY